MLSGTRRKGQASTRREAQASARKQAHASKHIQTNAMSENSRAEGTKKKSQSQGTTAERSLRPVATTKYGQNKTKQNKTKNLKRKRIKIMHRLLVRVSLSVGEEASITATPASHGFANTTKIRFYETIPLLLPLLERLHTSMYNFPSPNLTRKKKKKRKRHAMAPSKNCFRSSNRGRARSYPQRRAPA